MGEGMTLPCLSVVIKSRASKKVGVFRTSEMVGFEREFATHLTDDCNCLPN
jgi:hypothetical protein